MARHVVGKLFEERIRPAIPMAIRGVLWDQGENITATAGPDHTTTMNTLNGAQVRIRFNHTNRGLATKGGDKLQGFMIAGNRKFHWADATIDAQTVVVSSPDVAQPVAVRYAWADTCPWASPFNQDGGIPAQTFRTDDW